MKFDIYREDDKENADIDDECAFCHDEPAFLIWHIGDKREIAAVSCAECFGKQVVTCARLNVPIRHIRDLDSYNF